MTTSNNAVLPPLDLEHLDRKYVSQPRVNYDEPSKKQAEKLRKHQEKMDFYFYHTIITQWVRKGTFQLAKDLNLLIYKYYRLLEQWDPLQKH